MTNLRGTKGRPLPSRAQPARKAKEKLKFDIVQIGTKRKQPPRIDHPNKRLKPGPPISSSLTPLPPLTLPFEILEQTLHQINVKTRFHLGVILSIVYKYPYIRDATIPLLKRASMDAASRKGQIDLLDWWKSYLQRRPARTPLTPTPPVNITSDDIEESNDDEREESSSDHGHGWELKDGAGVGRTDAAMDGASLNGHVSVLQWWKDSGLELKFSHAAMDGASSAGHVKVLEWWVANIPNARPTCAAIDGAAENGHLVVLKWWRDECPGIGVSMSNLALEGASENGHLHILEWWRDSGWGVFDGVGSMRYATEDGRLDVLHWWKDRSGLTSEQLLFGVMGSEGAVELPPKDGYDTKWDEPPDGEAAKDVVYNGEYEGRAYGREYEILSDMQEALCEVARVGALEVLNWWRDSKLLARRYWPIEAFIAASGMGELAVLDWWVDNGLQIHRNDIHRCLDAASDNGHIQVFEWWKHRGGKAFRDWCSLHHAAKNSGVNIDNASGSGHLHILQYLQTNAIPISYSEAAIDTASANGHIAILNWWTYSGLKLKYRNMLFDASINNRIDVLNWWAKPGEPRWNRKQINEDMAGMEAMLEYVSKSGFVEVLEWWRKKKFRLIWSMVMCGGNMPLRTRRWWVENGFVPREAVWWEDEE
ncbi:hypothetical protein HDV00_000233 [Rhizophlyctis rosea]|nr:hypothetical protein HDV00_000233 [Rhizophlyctis rosea]